jgi:hypothetical protein
MLGLLQAKASSPEVVSAPEQASVFRLLPIALIGGVLEGLSLSSFLNNAQNSIFFGLREIYVSIVVRDVDDDIERLGHGPLCPAIAGWSYSIASTDRAPANVLSSRG